MMELDQGDLPLVLDAFSIQASTEWMSQRNGAKQRLLDLIERYKGEVPKAAEPFESGDWAVLTAVASAGGALEVGIEKPEWSRWSETGYITVTIGNAKWRSSDSTWKTSAPILEEIREHLRSLLPMAE
jgi:hypothetical protein